MTKCQDEYEEDESLSNTARLITGESFSGSWETGSSFTPASSHLQVDLFPSANGDAPHRWEKKLL